ncbi:unnamed protein product [Larinioides sclopetarius]|uniref:Uncharacterized protein n=2 Tax=Larinioides sclopetarius TaxID=280406 RepID=A0AAV2BXZ3_9ARAC
MKPIMNRKEGNHIITYDVYVGTVPKNFNENDLKQLFSQHGEVKQVLCRWKEDYFGYGIVKFAHKQDADKILRDYQEVTWKGHTMPVKTARRSEHGNQNGNSNMENKPNVYSDLNKNQLGSGSNFSNTDFGHFQYPPPPPSVNEQVIRSQPSQPVNLNVLCTSVEDSVTFYGYPINRSEDLMMITSSLNNLNYNRNPLEKKPSLRKVYAALFSEDNSWYRCSVIKNSLPNKPGMCSVRYIDYGNQEETTYQNIVEIPESLQRIPPIASKFVLSSVVCDTKATNKKSCLHQLVNQRITLSARLSNNMEYQVFRCTCNGKDVILDINKNFPKLGRHDSSNQDFNSKPRAYACGIENRVPSNHNSHASSLYIPKSLESPVNGNTTSSKKVLKGQFKSKEGSPKGEEVYCNGTAEEIKKDDDFHPKMIIKRGSELGDIVRKTSVDTLPKEKNSAQPAAYTLDSVHPNLKFINNIRSLVSQSSDDSIISYAVNLLKNEISTLVHSEASIKSVVSASHKYWESVENLKIFINQKRLEMYTDMGSSFSFEEKLSCLKSTRDSLREDLFNELKDYIGSCDNTIFQRKEKIQKVITDLESNSNAWMNVQLPKKPENIDELILEYNKVKEVRWNLVSKTRAKTDQAHQQFDNILSAIQKEFHLNTLEENEVPDLSSNVYNVGKTTSFDDQLKKALTVFGIALEEEIQTLTVNKDSGNYSVIQCLLDILDVHKEKIDALCDHYENHYAVYNELNKLPDIEKTLKDFKSASEEVHTLREELCLTEGSSQDGSPQEMSTLRRQLHCTLLREDSLKENKLLLKNWRPEYFLNFGAGQRGESSYVSHLHDEPITIKEYSFENAEECNAFIQKAVQWNEVRSDHIVKIKALFHKNEKTVCVMLPSISSTLLRNVPPTSPCDGEKACRILRQVLIGLKDIHSAGLVHHAVHPTTVVIENEKALVDFCFDPNFLDGIVNHKGINFLPPEIKATHESVDMYGFGCLVLWALFPNLSFTSTEEGIPNVAAFRSIIQELILPKDYAFLSSLIGANPERRPSSCTLLSKGFLSKYEAYCRSRCDTQKSASM